MLLQKVQVWIFCRENGPKEPLFLILRTNPKRGGFWQPVTGSVDPGEEIEAAALREAQEESGLTGKLIALNHSFQYEARGKNFVEYGFALEVGQEKFSKNAVKIDSHEHDAFEWVNETGAKEKILFDSNIEMLSLLTAKLNESIIA